MRRALIAALCLMAPIGPTEAADLRGQWSVTIPTDPTFSGAVLIDGSGRVTWDAVWDRQWRLSQGSTEPGDGKAKWRGYLRITNPRIELILTNGAKVDRLYCTVQSSDLMHCYSFLSSGKPGAITILTRVGRGPTSLAPR